MKRLLLNAAHLLLIAGVISGGQLTCAQSAAAVDRWAGKIVDIQPRQPRGRLQVSRKQGGPLKDGTIGMTIKRGYSLIVAAGTTVIVACADGSSHPLKQGTHPCRCKAPEINPLVVRGGADTAGSTYPVIISPRATRLLSTRPTLRWSRVHESSSDTSAPDRVYSVSIVATDMKPVLHREGVKTNELPYPSDENPLKPGTYLLVVSTDTGNSDDERMSGREFVVLPTCSDQPLKTRGTLCLLAQRVLDEEKRIRKLNLADDSTALLIASLYASNKLYAEAIEELEKAYAKQETPAVMRALGDLYATIGLPREAEESYLKALAALRTADDPEAEASALYALAVMYEQLGNFELTGERYKEAIRVYEKLRDKEKVEELKHRLAELGIPN